MESYAYYNHKFGKKEDILIPLSDRSIYFGDAIYDAAIGSYDRILWENEHISRFLLNAKRIGIDNNLTPKYLSELLREIAVKTMLDSYFIYFQLSRSLPHRTHSAIGAKANLLITIDPIQITKDAKPLKLLTETDRRFGYCHIKTTNLLPGVLASTKAEKSNCDEAVFIRNGFVTECAKSNILIIKRGRVVTHPKNNRILPGIAREHLLCKCKEFGIPFLERPFTKKELFSADEILVTSTTKLCKRVSHINGISVGGKAAELSKKLSDAMYFEYESFCKI